jgi:hypothetical protein
MQTNGRLIIYEGKNPSYQFGGLMSGLGGMAAEGAAGAAGAGAGGMMKGIMGGIKGGGGLGAMAGAAGDMLGGLLGGGPKQDPIAGGIEKGLDPAEMSEVKGAGKGAGVASGVLGGLGDVAGMIPGPWGAVASGVLNGVGSFLGGKQASKQAAKVDMLAKLNTNRKTDSAQMEALSQLGQKGGVLYKRPGDQILSLVSGGIYKDGGKAPELKWNHKFAIDFPESVMEKKKLPVKVFKRGGKFSDPDKTNIIVAGSRHHESNALGDKGIPVIDNTGEKVFEVEKGELILTKEVTNKIEDLLAKYKKVEVDEDKAHEVLKNLGSYFKEEISENLHNYEENVV